MGNVTVLLFDNSVFRKIVKKDPTSAEYSYIENLTQYLNSNFPAPFVRLMPPFLILEICGIKVAGKPPSFSVFHRNGYSEELEEVLKHSIEFFTDQEYLSRDAIRAKYEGQRFYFSTQPYAREFLEDTIERVLAVDSFEESIQTWLAHDHILQRPMWQSPLLEINQKLIVETFRKYSEGIDLPLFRLADRVLTETIETKRKLEKAKTSGPSPASEKKPFKLESRQDYIDTDLIYYAVMGTVERPSSKVVVLTEDDHVEVHNRLVWYRTFLPHLVDIFDSAQADFSFPSCCFGTALIVNEKTGDIDHRFDVSGLVEDKYLRAI